MKEEARVYLEMEFKYGSGLGLKNSETVLSSEGLQKRAGKGGKAHG